MADEFCDIAKNMTDRWFVNGTDADQPSRLRKIHSWNSIR
jgi:hypothetical protein